MPEGPEAYTMADYLRNGLLNKSILAIDIYDEKHSKGLQNLQLPCVIRSVFAYGKRPIFETDKGYLMTFLCMHGRWLYQPSGHTRISLTIGTNNIPEYCLYFDDKRAMGIAYLEYIPTVEEMRKYASKIGPDLLRPDTTTLNTFLTIARKKFRNTTVLEDFLLSPKSNCSIGNYLKSEVLYHSRINPNRTLGQCSDQDLTLIYNVAVWLCQSSYSSQGFTIQDYLKPDGTHGMFKCEVYGREGEKDKHGFIILRYKGKTGRSTFWVPELQV